MYPNFCLCKIDCYTCREQEEGVVYEGNQQWEGYSLDLIDAISKILHFQYRFELVPDGTNLKISFVVFLKRFFILFFSGKYGSYNKITKQWDGLVKHLLDRVSC